MPSIDWNLEEWGARHEWACGGDEWSDIADYCNQPYAAWKRALIETFIDGLVPPVADVVEIAPGYGRWTEHLLAKAAHVDIVDINQNCLDTCVKRFSSSGRLDVHLSPGSSLPFLSDGSADFVWSFDSFVHMDPPVVAGYISEVSRVLRPGGKAVIHHADLPSAALRIAPIARRLGIPGRVAMTIAGQHRLRDNGNRSPVSAAHVRAWGESAGLSAELQTSSWGARGQYTVDKYRDCITVFTRVA